MHPAETCRIRAISFDSAARKSLPASTTPPCAVSRLAGFAWLLCLAGSLGGCEPPAPAGTAAASCPGGTGTPMRTVELFFGRSIRGQPEVSDRAWDEFVTRVITPNLPSGYTVFDAAGAWRDPATGRGVREHTKVLLVALPDGPGGIAAITRIRQDYQRQFHQSLVGMTDTAGCGEF